MKFRLAFWAENISLEASKRARSEFSLMMPARHLSPSIPEDSLSALIISSGISISKATRSGRKPCVDAHSTSSST